MVSGHASTREIKPVILDEVNPVDIPRPVLVDNDRSFSWITDKICGIVEEKTPTWWWVCFVLACGTARSLWWV
jgi:molybdopterin-containing oxidoreductase family membrane subunit